MACSGCGLETGADGRDCPVCRSRRRYRTIRSTGIGLLLGLVLSSFGLPYLETSQLTARAVLFVPLAAAALGWLWAQRQH